MNRGRLWAVCRLDLSQNARRPLFWIWIIIIALTAWEMSAGEMQIGSGDSQVGGTKAFITSEFAFAMTIALLGGMIYPFFLAVAAGMTVIREDELKVSELVHATPLSASEYVWGKFLAVLLSAFAVLFFHLLASIVFNHALAGADSAELIGPLQLGNYLKPALFFAVPFILFVAGTTFAIGELTRRPILVFFFPVALFLVCVFFLWNWMPSWLDPRINTLLMNLDPTGFRWLNETWLSVDRGVDFYNEESIGLGWLFPLSRLGFLLFGVFAVTRSKRHFERTLRGSRKVGGKKRGKTAPPVASSYVPKPVSVLHMRARRPGFARSMLRVARVEFRELRGQPGLYLFIPLILVFTVANASFLMGAFETMLLVTPGALAVRSMGWLTTLGCLLLMFYMVESLRRESGTGIRPMVYSTPIGTGALLAGKALANVFVALAIVFATLVACVSVLLFQGKVAFDAQPFLIVWGLLLLPTYFFWCSFVSAIYAVTGSRYTTYGLALGALVWTGFKAVRGDLDWCWNWPLWGALQWSDMGTFELVRESLVLNRILVLGAALFLIALTVRVFPRRAFDATRTLVRLRPRALAVTALRLAPFAAVPLVAWFLLAARVDDGFQGEGAENLAKDYWRKNVATWTDSRIPDTAAVDVDLTLEPEQRRFHVKGTYELVNREEEPLRQIPITGGFYWEDLAWTMDGEAYEPEDREHLYVFTPPEPLATGDRVVIGFEHSGTVPHGSTKNGGGSDEFILPSGVVLTSFRPTFAPVVGYVEGIGVDEDNRYDSKEYPDDFYEGVTRSAFGSGAPFTTRVSITGPPEYTFNSVGKLVDVIVFGLSVKDLTAAEQPAISLLPGPPDTRRTVIWESDHPVRFFNVVGGRYYDVWHGDGTAIYYHPEHDYNIEEMGAALDAARKHYSEWFYPFPWNELRMSEFPALAGYAQGFPTNITFSENLGFLTKSDTKANAVFMVTAHESAHQWWANILTPGYGPGGNLLSEGTANFSTILLFEEVLGQRDRIEFCKRIESQYAEQRQVDSERPLVKIDGSRAGDQVVTYDKAGWVFWMQLLLMGRENALAGIQSFIEHYKENRDHPVLQDYVAHLRPFAPDLERYDDFVAQWFFDVVVPEYELSEAQKTRIGGNGSESWEVVVNVKNAGTGTMPVEICASVGERFPEEGDEASDMDETAGDAILAAETAGDAEPVPYAEKRATIVLAPDEEQTVTLRCRFDPERIVVDPDALVLQLARDRAIHRF